jgi:hypothetical protein
MEEGIQVHEGTITTREVLEAAASRVDPDLALPERVTIAQVSPQEHVMRVYLGRDNEYEGYLIALD